MKCVLVLFDTLNRHSLTPYGGPTALTPNFTRLAERATTYDKAFVGSMPCIPARRELHTGRNNFLHRSWGPLEPFDDSMPQSLKASGVHAHLVTDHYHYFEDGGSGYHTKYSTWELVRGQAGDPWKGVVDYGSPANPFGAGMFGGHWAQEWINRDELAGKAPGEQTFDLGLRFLEANAAADNWFLQIETFDPHEPFWLNDEEIADIDDDYDGPEFFWPPYRRVQESQEQVDHLRRRYLGVVRRCDKQLGRVLDFFDEHDLWEDTMLIVTTDHGLLLGEHGWWGKTGPRSKTGPQWFNEIAHIPLFVSTSSTAAPRRSERLASMVDIPATIMDWFDVAAPDDMTGESLLDREPTATPREALLFGAFGGHVNVTDGRYVYMRAAATPDNRPLHEYTLAPYGLPGPVAPEVLGDAELHEPFSFTKGAPVLKLPVRQPLDISEQPSSLYDCEADPRQEHPLDDDVTEARMTSLMVELMQASDAPADQFERLGLPKPQTAAGEDVEE